MNNLGFKFWLKYFIVLIPLLILMIPSVFLPKHKAVKYALENKLTNYFHEWVWK